MSVFIINRVFYSSDDGYDRNTLIGYVTSEQDAVELVANLNNRHKEAEILKKKIYEYECILINIEHEKHEECPIYPKWKQGIHQDEITIEMRKERNRIIELQNEVHKRNNEKDRIRREKIESLKQAYIDSLHIRPDVLEVFNTEQRYESVLRYAYEKIEKIAL